jgi:hypothetical protein
VRPRRGFRSTVIVSKAVSATVIARWFWSNMIGSRHCGSLDRLRLMAILLSEHGYVL